MSQEPINQLKKIAVDCRQAARIYEERPGLVGHGANAGTICDIYYTIALIVDRIVETESPAVRKGEQ
jgi:hypothetical protein